MLKGKLVGFGYYTIYNIYIEKQNQIIRIKDLCIFEDIENEKNTSFSSYNNTSLF